MSKCLNELDKSQVMLNKEVPKSLSENDDYILVSKACKENKCKENSKFCFIRKDICEKCKEEEIKKLKWSK